MTFRRVARLWLLALAALLASCGGGGGADEIPTSTGTLAGTVSYDYVPNINGALSYNATVSKPVRGASVDIVNARSGAVVASATTDDNGHYSASVPSPLTVIVRVNAQLSRSGSGPSWNVAVRDNTQANALYALESPSFSTGNISTRDLHAASGWGSTRYTGERVAAPFAILDTVYSAMGKVLSVAPSTAFPPLSLYWSTRNAPSDGLISQGQIGTTSFVANPTGPIIYVLGLENVDTDEYDASVIAHEWGHYFMHAFSRDDSPGGDHDFDAFLDQRLAFSEGWGNAWSGIVLNRQNYTDSTGSGQAAGVNMDLSVNSETPKGWYGEAAVQTILWNLNNRDGFAGIYQAMTGGLGRTPAVTSIHSFAAAYGAAAPYGQGDLALLLAAQSVSTSTNDPWATGETNDGGVPIVIPIYRPATAGAGGAFNACVTNQNGADNKLGSFAYLRVAVPSARVYQISVTGPTNADPDFYVYAGSRLAASESPGDSEMASVSLPAGDVVIAVDDAKNSSSNTCFTIRID